MSKIPPARPERPPVIVGGCTCGGDLHYSLEMVDNLARARVESSTIKAEDLPVRIQRYRCQCAPAGPQRPFRAEGCGACAVRITNRYGLLWQNGKDGRRPW